jgi:hypothetical protein
MAGPAAFPLDPIGVAGESLAVASRLKRSSTHLRPYFQSPSESTLPSRRVGYPAVQSNIGQQELGECPYTLVPIAIFPEYN